MLRKKVLYIITKHDVGGAQKYVHDLAENLNKSKFETKILYGGRPVRSRPSAAGGTATAAMGRPASNGIKWLSNKTYPHLLFLNDWLAIFELAKTFRRERPDIIHLNSSKAGVLGSLAAWLYKIFLVLNPKPHTLYPKVIFTAHGWVFNPTNYYPATVRWFYILLHKFAALFQDKIINVSEYDRKLALRYKIAPSHKLVTIYNGIDPNIPFLDKQTARKEIIKRLNLLPYTLNPKLPWVGSIGRLTKEKNYETLIRAAAMFQDNTNYANNNANVANSSHHSRKSSRDSHYAPYFFVIGDGPEKDKLQKLITNHSPYGRSPEGRQLQNRFFIIPPSGKDAIYLKAFDVFALTSIKEGLPYTLLEAMAAELPIVTTDVGGMPEIVSQKGNGRIVPLGNPAKLSAGISELLSKRKNVKRLATTATPALKENFSLKRMIAATKNIY